MKKKKEKSGLEIVQLHLQLNHQVAFGEHVVILGSAKELGSWKKKVPMKWTENGWVCDLEFKGDESIEYKFVIVKEDKSVLWESGDNRVLKLPKRGKFEMVCHWNMTGEAVDILAFGEVSNVCQDVSPAADSVAHLEVEASPFVGQWQGKTASFMRSNEHRDREAERKWDTMGLQGLAIKLVEGDQNARNWWRKVIADEYVP